VNFAELSLDATTSAFLDQVRAFLDELVTDDVHEEEWRTGSGHHDRVHRALGARGWLYPTWPPEEGGVGATELEGALFEHELVERDVPTVSRGTTRLVAGAVRRWMPADVQAELLPLMGRGELLAALGYTEPDGGSDLASVRTRAVRDGDDWVIAGQKMFTTGAQHCDYAFALTRTDPDLPKHKGLTTFLVPLKVPGVEIQAVHTVGGERTNMVFFDDVRVPDRLRVGPVNEGWAVVNGPLNAERGIDEAASLPLEEQPAHDVWKYVATMARTLHHAVEWAFSADHDGRRPIDDAVVRNRLARLAVDVELARATPGPMGRIVSSETLIRGTAEVLDLIGPRALIRRRQRGAIADGWFEYAHRYAQGTAIYGGTTDITRNVVAEQFLGLPRSRPASRT
jgi:alkylation response protein AidB-like acyl-CoA dehydrogenase